MFKLSKRKKKKKKTSNNNNNKFTIRKTMKAIKKELTAIITRYKEKIVTHKSMTNLIIHYLKYY
jgi:hypothetical protein